jgi:radical SAM superfamily enzyme with C-terminal helix-hairpin-helix motif
VYFLYFTGRGLDSVQKELEAAIHVITQLNQGAAILHISILLTGVKMLRGLDGEAGDKILDSILASAAESHNHLAAYVNLMKLEVFVLFQQWRLG